MLNSVILTPEVQTSIMPRNMEQSSQVWNSLVKVPTKILKIQDPDGDFPITLPIVLVSCLMYPDNFESTHMFLQYYSQKHRQTNGSDQENIHHWLSIIESINPKDKMLKIHTIRATYSGILHAVLPLYR